MYLRLLVHSEKHCKTSDRCDKKSPTQTPQKTLVRDEGTSWAEISEFCLHGVF